MKNKPLIFVIMLMLVMPAAFALVWQNSYWLPVGTADPNTIAFGATAKAASGSFSSIDKQVSFKAELLTSSGALIKVLASKTVDLSVYTGYETVDVKQSDYVSAGNYYVRFTITDSQGLKQKQLALIVTSTPANQNPTITCPGAQSVNEGSPLQFTVSGSDPDSGDTITFSATNTPSGSSFDATQKKFSWTPSYDQAGSYTSTFTVTDNHGASASCNVQISVVNTNRCPTLNQVGNKAGTEGQSMSFTVSASDPDSDTLVYSASGIPSGATLDASTGIFIWSSPKVGTYTVTFTVTDGLCPKSETITITIVAKNKPVASLSAAPKEGPEGTTVTFACTASGGDLPLSYKLSFGDGSASVTTKTATHKYTTQGLYTASCIVTDADGDASTATVAINITESVPVVKLVATPKSGNSPLEVDFDCQVTGGNAPFTYFIDFGDGSNSVLQKVKHNYTSVNTYIASCTVTDDDADIGYDYVSINVTKNNTCPVLATIGNKTVQANSTLNFTVKATDADGNALSYSADVPYSLFINSTTGNFSWTPASLQVGNHSATFSADDGKCKVSETINIQVTALPVQNTAPKANFTWVPASPKVNQTINFTSTSTDAEGGNLSCSWDFNADGTADSAKCSDVWNFTKSGNYTVKLNVSDGNLSDSVTKTVEVFDNKTNNAPKADFTWSPSAPEAGQTVNFTSTSTDPDSDKLTCDWDLDNDGFSDSTQCNTSKVFAAPGFYPVKLTVSDGNLTDSTTKNVTVTGKLNVTGITCFSPVVEKSLESCSVSVEGSNGLKVGGANVKLYYLNSTLLKNCITDMITGNCVVTFPTDSPGNYTVYATAEKSGWTSDLDKTPTAEFEVFAKKYIISNLAVYNDSAFLIEDYDFFRNENMYVHFIVLDKDTGNPTDNLVTSVSLVSPPGGVAWFSKYNYSSPSAGNYYYSLKIPKTHDFLGDSQVFTFAFNFTDKSGAQMVVQVTIRNNLPVINQSVVNEFTGVFNETKSLSLTPYEFDVEDSGANLTWSVLGVDTSVAKVSVDSNDTLTVIPVSAGYDIVTLMLKDLDGATATIDVPIKTTILSLSQCADGKDNDGDTKIDFPADSGCSNASDDNETDVPPVVLTECADGKDNDGDTKIDFPADSGCSNASDDNETDVPPVVLPQCSDLKDNDGDGKIDLLDLGCANSSDDNESDDPVILPQCNDLKDNDGDGKIDLADPGCSSSSDNNESDDPVVLPQCADSVDNDGDGKIDMFDPGCANAQDNNETDPVIAPQCSDGKDNDGDGKVDMFDPGCSSIGDNDETDPVVLPQCNDLKDNDGDGKIDLSDPGCSSSSDNNESDDPAVLPQCADNKDNDADGKTDFPADPGCSSALDDDETDVAGNQPPVAVVKLSRNYGAPSLVISVNGSSSYDNDGTIAGHSWLITGPNNYTYSASNSGKPGSFAVKFSNVGTYQVRLTVIDDKNATGTETKTVTISTSYTQCDNGIDDDGDGKIDFPADLHCSDKNDNLEGEMLMPKQVKVFKDQDDLVINRVDINGYDVEGYAVEAGGYLTLSVAVRNNLKVTLEDLKVDASIQELGIRDSDLLRKLSPGDTATVTFQLDIPDYAESGLYDMRFVFSNDDVRRVKYRTVTIA